MAKVKIKIATIGSTDAQGRPVFMEALDKVLAGPLPARTFYWLNKIRTVALREYQEYEAVRVRIVTEMGVKTDTGYQVPPHKLQDFVAALQAVDHAVELPIDEGVMLELPGQVEGQVWAPLVVALDIFAEPSA